MTRAAIRGSAKQIFALTLIVGVFFTAQDVFFALAAGHPANALRDLQAAPLFWGVWAFLTRLVLAGVRRWPLDVKPISRSLVAHLLLAVVLATLQSLLTLGLQSLPGYVGGALGARDALAMIRNPTALVWGIFTGVFFYSVVVIVYTALRFRSLYANEQLGAAALEAELAHSKLETLRSQLRPHFLFNALNAVSVLVVDDPSKAKRILLRISSLLRRSLDERAHEISLRHELGFLDDYLAIQRMRFGDRLDVRILVGEEIFNARIPVLLLQPLVENAIEHGESENGSTSIVLRAEREGEILHLSVEDTGPGMKSGSSVREGVGLRNTRARLHHLYGQRATLELRPARHSVQSPGVRVDIRLPFAVLQA
jgi:two-component system, LytTR family, sensor kinase